MTTHYHHGRITVGGVDLDEVADRFGSPTYVLDEVSVNNASEAVSRRFRNAEILCSTCSLLTGGVARSVAGQRHALVVHSHHEGVLARRSGVDPDRIIQLIGSAESGSCSVMMLAAGRVGRIVVDADAPIEAIRTSGPAPQQTIVRVHTPRCAEAAVGRVVAAAALDLVGVRCDTAPTPDGIRDQVLTAVAVMCDAYREHRVLMTQLHVGIATGRTDIDGAPDLGEALDDALDEACIRNRFPRPSLAVEVGESLTARAAVTVCRVRGVDRTHPTRPPVVVVESGTRSGTAGAQGAPVSAAIANRHPLGPTETISIVDHRSVSGVPLLSGVVLSQDIRAGDVVALVSPDGSDLVGSASVVSVAHGRAHQIQGG
nr:diaminopimelate decarboxylase [Rhodococcus sp. JVH1]